LDDFKNTNDLHGHSVGDRLLELVGEEFSKILVGLDSVARFGGDEFVFCFPNLDDLQQAHQKVAIIQDIFKQQFLVQGKFIYSSCSVGVAMYPDDGDVAEDLISKADIVLYKSKSIQKGRAMFFDKMIDQQVQREFVIEEQLRLALTAQEFTIVYQPQISVVTKQIIGVEALIRWNNAILGSVPPDEFIKKAEAIGIIPNIGQFVIEKALFDVAKFNLEFNGELQLSINISPKQLIEPLFVEHIMSASQNVGFAAKLVMLEITENVLISDLNKVGPVLDALKVFGFKLSLDDFGSGYSSLSYLSDLPINEIKIDRSFIDKFLINSQSESLVKTIIAIGQFYDLTVVAEGVETQEQYQRLKRYNCDLIQGYYFDRPLSLAQLSEKYQSLTLS